jgi:hypothetical protein
MCEHRFVLAKIIRGGTAIAETVRENDRLVGSIHRGWRDDRAFV